MDQLIFGFILGPPIYGTPPLFLGLTRNIDSGPCGPRASWAWQWSLKSSRTSPHKKATALLEPGTIVAVELPGGAKLPATDQCPFN